MPLLASQGHLPGEGGDLTLGERLIGLGDPSTGPATFGAERRAGLGGARLSVSVGVLLDEPGGEVSAEVVSTQLALVEGHQVGLVVGVEHQIKGGGGVAEPAAAKFFAWLSRLGLSIIHRDAPWSRGCCTGRSDTVAPLSYPSHPRAGTRLHSH
jgi:hypothetical protein